MLLNQPHDPAPAPALPRFDSLLAAHELPPLRRRATTTLQVNMGKWCNQACRHCHVDAGPQRSERMDGATVERLLAVLAASPQVGTVDVTGGAPELNENFRPLVDAVAASGRSVIVRCNLTVLEQEGQEDTAEFYASRRVTVVASLPCYTAGNTDGQRGSGVFDASLRALRRLNALGYGAAEGDTAVPGLRLHLVYNPQGPSLPPPQESLERDYHERLRADHGVVFDRLYTITNMPIHRFAEDLARQGQLDDYAALLAEAFNPAAVEDLMCRDLVSVDWDGRLADCDFHQMLGLPLGAGPRSIFDVETLGSLDGAAITTAEHCLGCTAGQGSSCGGALAPGD